MAKFVFNLEPVLQQRRLAEDQCQRDLAKVTRERMILLDQLRQMQTTIVTSKRDLRDGLIGQVDMDRVGNFARFSGQTTARAHQLVTRIAALEKQVESSRARLIDAAKARKAIERLRELQFQKWKQQQDRRESAMLDEIGVGAFAFHLMTQPPSPTSGDAA
ncbi:MAG: flagellar export protein FliJ [Phycisphaeraceae bacterium]